MLYEVITLIWMSVFGGLAIEQVIDKVGELGASGLTDVSLAMFQMFDVLRITSYNVCYTKLLRHRLR